MSETRRIPLTKGYFATVDSEDYAELNKSSWQCQINDGGKLYGVRVENHNGKKKKVYMHRQIMKCPVGLVVDHINGDSLLNTKENLRRATTQQNTFNRLSFFGASKFKGVTWDRRTRKWRARISFRNKNRHIGYFSFECEEQAAEAYDERAFELYEEFAVLNFPERFENRITTEMIPF